MKSIFKYARIPTLIIICLLVGGCDDVRVYGSVGFSSYGGYGGMGTRVGVGGRIY